MYVATLTHLNVQAATDLVMSRSNFLAIKDPEMLELQQRMTILNLQNVLDEKFTSLGTVFGAWSDDGTVLQALLVTILSTNQPCWYINKAYTRPGADLSALSLLWASAIKHHKDLGYKRFYCLYPEQKFDVYQRLWRTDSLLKDYLVYTEYRSAPLERLKFQEFWELLYGRILYNEPMLVRAFIHAPQDQLAGSRKRTVA